MFFSDFYCVEDISANRVTTLGHGVAVLPASVGNSLAQYSGYLL